MACAAACNNVARKGFKVVRSFCEGLGAGSRKKRAFRGDSEVRARPSPGFHASLAYWPLLVSCTPPAPEDVSVVGFDDIQIAQHNSPSLTTVRQPLQEMGETAARILLNRIDGREAYVSEVRIEPELVVPNSTARAPA
jgi:hypothetical protein